jgi:hypothetical protein
MGSTLHACSSNVDDDVQQPVDESQTQQGAAILLLALEAIKGELMHTSTTSLMPT